MTTLELSMCPACGKSISPPLSLSEDRTLRRCPACETVSAFSYTDPAEVYVDGYMFGQAGPFGLDVRHPTYQRYLTRVADRRMAIIERTLGVRSGTLLDVGCGTGEVLEGARRRGWTVTGVEPERTAGEMARDRGLEVVVSTLEQSGLPRRSFDVVSAFHVLEHVADARAFLTGLADWARPGGTVVVEVPNFDSVQRRRLRAHWPNLRPGEHLTHFTPATLAKTFRACGMSPLAVRSPAYVGPPQTLDHALNDLVRHGRYRRLLEPLSRVEHTDAGAARVPTRTGWWVLRATEAVYDRAGVGSVVLCIATVG